MAAKPLFFGQYLAGERYVFNLPLHLVVETFRSTEKTLCVCNAIRHVKKTIQLGASVVQTALPAHTPITPFRVAERTTGLTARAEAQTNLVPSGAQCFFVIFFEIFAFLVETLSTSEFFDFGGSFLAGAVQRETKNKECPYPAPCNMLPENTIQQNPDVAVVVSSRIS